MNRVAIFLLLASTNTAAYAGDPAFYDNERLNRADVTGTVSVSAKAPKRQRPPALAIRPSMTMNGSTGLPLKTKRCAPRSCQ